MKSEYSAARRSTLLIFLICGLGLSSWAPMVPYAKERMGLNDAELGGLLLLLGGGAMLMMPLTGFFIQRVGSRKIMLVGSIGFALFLPLLLFMSHPASFGAVLFLFGASMGAVDVSMNAHAVKVQKLYGRHIMSTFHGLFSVGGLFGALGLGLLIKGGLSPIVAATIISLLLILIATSQYKHLLPHNVEGEMESSQGFRWPKGILLYLGVVCFILFLAEGAILDWSAVFLQLNRGVATEISGVGYALFSVAMAVMRLSGDRLIHRIRSVDIVVYGSLVSAAGFFIAVIAPWSALSLFGFILVGLGCANIVPVLFSAAGNLKDTPAYIAIPTITTIGYTGQLAGPAMLGFIAYFSSLPMALGLVGLLLLVVTFSYRRKPLPKE